MAHESDSSSQLPQLERRDSPVTKRGNSLTAVSGEIVNRKEKALENRAVSSLASTFEREEHSDLHILTDADRADRSVRRREKAEAKRGKRPQSSGARSPLSSPNTTVRTPKSASSSVLSGSGRMNSLLNPTAAQLAEFPVPVGKPISIENFDPLSLSLHPITSPRTLLACAREGINPRDLLKKDASELYGNKLASSVPAEVLQVRLDYAERSRQSRVNDVIRARNAILHELEDDVIRVNDTSAHVDDRYVAESDVIAFERERVEKLRRQQEAHARIMREFESKMRYMERETFRRMQGQQRREEEMRRKGEREREERERERVRKEAEFRKALERQNEEKRRKMEESLERLRVKEEARERFLEEMEIQRHQHTQSRAQQHSNRLQAAKERERERERERRRKVDEKEKIGREKERKHVEKMREQLKSRQADAERRQSKLRAAQSRQQSRERERVRVLMEKQREIEERLENKRREEVREIRRKKEEEKERLRKRDEALKAAAEEERKRQTEQIAKQKRLEEQRLEAEKELELEREIEREKKEMVQREKLEMVERMRKKREQERREALKRIEVKQKKAEMVEREKKRLIEDMRAARRSIDKNTPVLEKLSPGPADYCPNYMASTKSGPSYKFGISTHDDRARILSRDHLKEFQGRDTPGPGTYDVEAFERLGEEEEEEEMRRGRRKKRGESRSRDRIDRGDLITESTSSTNNGSSSTANNGSNSTTTNKSRSGRNDTVNESTDAGLDGSNTADEILRRQVRQKKRRSGKGFSIPRGERFTGVEWRRERERAEWGGVNHLDQHRRDVRTVGPIL